MVSLLDSPRKISRLDRGDMLGSIYKLAEPFLDSNRFRSRFAPRDRSVDSLVIVGMGGSASTGDVLLDWLGPSLDISGRVSRSVKLPRSVGKKTLVVFFSYSGETWETLGSLREALRIGCPVVGVGSGGKLQVLLEERGLPFFRVSEGFAPRAALGEMIVAGTVALRSSGIVGPVGSSLREVGGELLRSREKLRPEVQVSKNRAKKLGLSLYGMLPMLYGFDNAGSVVRRFKNQLAENAKVVAKYGLLPEACHNEIEAIGKEG